MIRQAEPEMEADAELSISYRIETRGRKNLQDPGFNVSEKFMGMADELGLEFPL